MPIRFSRRSSTRLAIVAALALSAASAPAQVDVSLTTSFDDALEGHASFGLEQLNAGGLTRDGDDHLLVTLASPRGADCPTPDPLVIYRRDRRHETPWVLEASLDPLIYGTRPWAVAIHGDTLVVGDSPPFGPHEGRALVYRRNGGAWDLEAELRASDADDWDLFGSAVDIHEDTIVVGAWNEGSGANATSFKPGPGAVYVYQRSGTRWTQIKKLTASDGENRDEFGRAVSVKNTWRGTSVLVGAPGDVIDENWRTWGSAYLYEDTNGNGWREVQQVTRPLINGVGRFGLQVALDTDIAAIASGRNVFAYDRQPAREHEQLFHDLTIELDDGASFPSIDVNIDEIVVGLSRADGREPKSGVIRRWALERFMGWVEQPRISSPFKAGDRAGLAVFVTDATIVTGTPGDDTVGRDSGAIHTFRKRNGRFGTEDPLLAGAAPPGGRFGTSVHTDGDTAIIGMPEADHCSGRGGYAFTYRWQTGDWEREKNIWLDGLAPDARFGAAAAVSGDVMILGAPNDGPSGQGSAHLFVRSFNGWTHEQSFELPQAPAGARFGEAIAIAPGIAVIGAPGAGAAVILTQSQTEWSISRVVTGAQVLGQAAEFGGTIAITNDRILIGAPGYDADHGAVCELTRDGVVDDVLLGDTSGDRFGEAIAADENVRLLASPGANGSTGRVDFFTRQQSQWNLHSSLTPASASDGYRFGASLALDGSIAVVGATARGDGRVHAYYFIDDVWEEFTTLGHPQGLIRTAFASSIALADERLLAAAPLEDGIESDEGAVHPMILDFRFMVPPCDGDFTADEIEAIRPDWLERGDVFGWSVAADGDVAVVGAPYADLHGEELRGNAGAVTVYRRTGLYEWTPALPLQPPDDPMSASDNWGWDVALDGDLLLVCAPGAPGHTVNDGAALVFWFDGYAWVELDRLIGDPDALPYSRFATAGDIDNGRIVLSAPSADSPDGVRGSGVAWVFEPTGPGEWEIIATLASDAPTWAEKFGTDVAISGDWIVVGAPERDDRGIGSGAAFVYRRSGDGTWAFHQKLIALDGDDTDRLGTSVAIEGDIIVAGAPYAEGTERGSGAAYLYRLDPNTNQWNFEAKLMGVDERHSSQAGFSLAVSGDTVAVGVPYGYHPHNGQRTGVVRLFSYDDDTGVWEERGSASPMIGNASDQFGQGVAITGGNVWVGASGVDFDPANPPDPYISSGQATTFDLDCEPPIPPAPAHFGRFLEKFNLGKRPADLAPPFGIIDEADIREYIRRMR